jgi:hypothetical protein
MENDGVMARFITVGLCSSDMGWDALDESSG